MKFDWVLLKGIFLWFGFRVWIILWVIVIEWIFCLYVICLCIVYFGFWLNLKFVLKKVLLLIDYKLLYIFFVVFNFILWLFIIVLCYGDEIVYYNIIYLIESVSCIFCICFYGFIGECYYYYCDIGLGMLIEVCDNWMIGEEGICCFWCCKRWKYYFK